MRVIVVERICVGHDGPAVAAAVAACPEGAIFVEE
jgi:hypothetical protein